MAAEQTHTAATPQDTGVLAHLKPAEIATIVGLAPLRRFRKGETIPLVDDGAVALVLVQEGRFLFSRSTGHGRRLVTVVVYPGSAFLHLPAGSRQYSSTEGEAQEPSAAHLLSLSHVEQLVMAIPHFALNLLRLEAAYARVLEEKFEMQAFSPLPARLAALLLRLEARRADGVEIKLSHGRLAEGVGASREAVTRALDAFQAEGIIQLSRTSVVIRDPEQLRSIAAGSMPDTNSH